MAMNASPAQPGSPAQAAHHPGIGGDGQTLDIRYAGHSDWQEVSFRIRTSEEPEVPLALWAVQGWLQAINLGGGGGARFAPEQGAAELLSAVVEGAAADDPKAAECLGQRLSFRARVKAVDERFVRALLEQAACSAGKTPATLLSFVGSYVPLANERRAINTNDMQHWLGDVDTYPERWASLRWRLVSKSCPRGMSLAVQLQGAKAETHFEAFEAMVSAWQDAVQSHPNLARKGRGVMNPQAQISRSGSRLLARLALFDYHQVTTRNTLVNMLQRFHAKVSPIAEAEVGFPG